MDLFARIVAFSHSSLGSVRILVCLESKSYNLKLHYSKIFAKMGAAAEAIGKVHYSWRKVKTALDVLAIKVGLCK